MFHIIFLKVSAGNRFWNNVMKQIHLYSIYETDSHFDMLLNTLFQEFYPVQISAVPFQKE